MLEKLPKFKMSAFNYKEQATLLNAVIEQVETNQKDILSLKEQVYDLEKAMKDMLDMIISPNSKKKETDKKKVEVTKTEPATKKGAVDVKDLPPIDLT